MAEKPKLVKTTLNLSEDAVKVIREIADQRGTTMTEVIRQAIALEKLLFDAEKEGSKVLIEEKDKTLKQIVIR